MCGSDKCGVDHLSYCKVSLRCVDQINVAWIICLIVKLSLRCVDRINVASIICLIVKLVSDVWIR